MASAFSVTFDPPSAANYNAVLLFEAQCKSAESAILLGVGQILVKHALHPLLRAILLHRHEHVQTNMAMVHSYVDPCTEACEMLDVADCATKHDTSPLSFRLNEANESQVFELLQAPDSLDVGKEFWEELPNRFWKDMGKYEYSVLTIYMITSEFQKLHRQTVIGLNLLTLVDTELLRDAIISMKRQNETAPVLSASGLSSTTMVPYSTAQQESVTLPRKAVAM
ncbi:hypothetical protein LTS15_010581 [Exophiala xenobiotica]|nr:hypothetical protein LTS15_010581 [Exophiala xenobiotica]